MSHPDWRAYVRSQLPPLDIPPERELEIVDELALQLEAAYDAAISRGESPEAARATALAEVPDWRAFATTLARIEQPAVSDSALGPYPRRGGFMSGIVQDVRYAFRGLRRSPGFAAVAITTLALGIAATTIVYSVVDAVLLRPLPIQEPERVVLARELTARGEEMSLSWPNFVDLQARATSFETLAAWRGVPANLTAIERPRRIFIRQVTWNLFQALGVKPILGRDLTADDDRLGVERVCLVSDSFWQRELGGDASALGRRISLDETPATVVGVLPPDFTVARQEDVFLPFGNFYAPGHFMLGRGNHNGLSAIGRLKRDVSIEQARSELSTIAAQLAAEYPNTNSGQGATVAPLFEVLVGPVRTTLFILLGAAGVMLLIGCVNIANLLIVRGAERAQELEVRLALGADRWRIVRQLLTESVLLAIVGGAAGIAIAVAGFDAVMALLPDDQPRVHTVTINGRVLAAAFAASVGTGLLFGIIPALQVGQRRAAALLRAGRVAGGGAARQRTRRALLVSELALAVVLLAAAGVMVRTMTNLFALELGFDGEHVLSARVSLPSTRYAPDARRSFVTQVEERLRATPGVEEAAFTISLPVQGSNWNSVFIVNDQAVPPRADLPSAAWTPISPTYFDVMRIQLLRGRGFAAADTPGAPLVAIVNETFAQRFWPNQDAIGRRVKQGWPEDETGWREIVGIVRDVKTSGVDRPPAMQVYMPISQMPQVSLTAVIRTEDDPARYARVLEAAIHEADPNLAVYETRTLAQVVERGVGQQRLLMMLLVGFSSIALLLAAVGVFGVNAYMVSQRTHELGVRMALGADRGRVLKLVLAQGFLTCVVGIGVGLFAAIATTRLLRTLLYEVTPADPITFAGVTGVLLLVTAAACYLPALRATRVDPVTALRAD